MFKIEGTLIVCICALTPLAVGCSGDAPAQSDVAEGDVIQDDAAGDTRDEDVTDDQGGRQPLAIETVPGIPLAGEWTDDWDARHSITSARWIQSSEYGTSTFEIVEFDIDKRTVIARNSDSNQFSPGLFSRFDWTEKDGTIFYCNSRFDATSVEEAANQAPADATDPENGGCVSFAWSRLSPIPSWDFLGIYRDGWGTSHTIRHTGWIQEFDGQESLFRILSVNLDQGYLVAENDSGNQYSPGLFSRLDWITFQGRLYFCHTRFDAATAADAESAPAPEKKHPDQSGCQGFAWTLIEPVAEPMTEIVDAPGDTGQGTGDAAKAVNGVRGGGRDAGGSDVFSIGFELDENGYLIIGIKDRAIKDGPGTDFAIFENVFSVGDGGMFMDPAVVLLSRDGLSWVPYPFDYIADDETEYSKRPSDWDGFAGVTPVMLNQETNEVDPFDQAVAGGDHFDLANLDPGDPEALAIRKYGFTVLKIIPAAIILNRDTGEAFVRDPMSNGPDIDGVWARNLLAD